MLSDRFHNCVPGETRVIVVNLKARNPRWSIHHSHRLRTPPTHSAEGAALFRPTKIPASDELAMESDSDM